MLTHGLKGVANVGHMVPECCDTCVGLGYDGRHCSHCAEGVVEDVGCLVHASLGVNHLSMNLQL